MLPRWCATPGNERYERCVPERHIRQQKKKKKKLQQVNHNTADRVPSSGDAALHVLLNDNARTWSQIRLLALSISKQIQFPIFSPGKQRRGKWAESRCFWSVFDALALWSRPWRNVGPEAETSATGRLISTFPPDSVGILAGPVLREAFLTLDVAKTGILNQLKWIEVLKKKPIRTETTLPPPADPLKRHSFLPASYITCARPEWAHGNCEWRAAGWWRWCVLETRCDQPILGNRIPAGGG